MLRSTLTKTGTRDRERVAGRHEQRKGEAGRDDEHDQRQKPAQMFAPQMTSCRRISTDWLWMACSMHVTAITASRCSSDVPTTTFPGTRRI